jgi:hypothetical protein
MNDTAPAASAAATVRFGRLPQRGLLLGFSAPRVLCVAGAAATAIPMLFTTGMLGVAASAPLWLTFLVLAFAPWHGRPAIETLPTAGHYLWRRSFGQTKHRARPSTPRPAGTMALPGDLAALRFHIDEDTGTAMVHDPHAGTLTAVALIRHPAYVLLSAEEQTRRVHGWGRALATLANSGTIARIQILEISLPDSGQGITGWWAMHGHKETSQWAVREYEELMRTCAPSASTHRTLIALSLDMRAARSSIRRRGRGLAGAAAALRQEMSSLESGLRAAELHLACWLDEPELSATLRTAYDPAHDASMNGGSRSLATAGPLAVDEHWDHLRHDTGQSAVLWVNEWPRVDAAPSFLHALVFRPGVRKTLSITATPVATAVAMRDIRRSKVEYATDATQKARIGALANLSDEAEWCDVIDRERALLNGHADLRITGLVAVTAPSQDELEAAVAEMERAAIQSGCETRRLFGQQARAYAAAALPLARKVS